MARPWAGSTRRRRLPANWAQLREETLSAPGGRTCRLQLPCCTGFATEVDHIVAGDDHGPGNRQPVCGPCHARKSAREGAAARSVSRGLARRPPEMHPGIAP